MGYIIENDDKKLIENKNKNKNKNINIKNSYDNIRKIVIENVENYEKQINNNLKNNIVKKKNIDIGL